MSDEFDLNSVEESGENNIENSVSEELPGDGVTMEETYTENGFQEEPTGAQFDYINYKQERPAKKKGNGGKVAKKVGAMVLSGVLFGAVAGGSLYGTNYLLEKNNATNTTQTSGEQENQHDKVTPGADKENKGDNKLTISDNLASGSDATMLTPTGDNLEVSQIVENCMPSVVAITNLGVSEVQTLWGTYEEESESCGSGVIIGKSEEELIILTNYHVVAGSKELTVVFSFDEASEEPEAVTAHVKGYEAERDIAVIGIKLEEIDDETMNSIKIAVIGDSEDLKLGEEVVAIGNALGYGQSVTTGIISALDRYVEIEGTDGIIISNDYIQTDAAINPGNSGGALLNTKGELIGINSAKVSDSSVEGMGYAIPISDVFDLINELMNLEARVSYSEEEQGYLCISGQDVSSDAVQYYGVPAGAYVIAVYEDYAAEEAGIEVGDIITKVNDVEVDSMTALKQELAYYEGGAEVTLTIMRQTARGGYEEIEVTAELNDYDEFLKLQDEMSSQSQQVQPEEDNNQQRPDDNGGFFWY